MLRSLLVLDWRKSKAHLLFLSKFLDARDAQEFLHAGTAQEFAKIGSWKDVIREMPQQAIKRFVDEGVLVTPGL